MDETDAEKAKAGRHIRILMICMAVGVTLPFLLFWLFGLKTT